MAVRPQIAAPIFDITSRIKQVALVSVTMLAAILAIAPTTQAQTFSVLYAFTGIGSDGSEPLAGLTPDAAGNFYGTTAFGGGNGAGTVYKLTHHGSSWIYSTLFAFNQSTGQVPVAPVVFGPDGTLYGTTSQGGSIGSGTVFNLRPPPTFCPSISCSWQMTVLHNFLTIDGRQPTTIGIDSGLIYGTTYTGGCCQAGVVYKLTPSGGSWNYSLIADLESTGAYAPNGGVVPDQAGNLYGTATGGGFGTVFEVNTSGLVQILHQFTSFHMGDGLYYGLISDSSGNLYGTTAFGGPQGGGGQVFELSPSNGGWDFSTLYSIPGGNCGSGALGTGSLVMDARGNLYGANAYCGTQNHGQIFELTPSSNGWIYTDLHDFSGGLDGCNPWGPLVVDQSGNIYGTASLCGEHASGLVWEITP